jgi:RimJ/RimL family protein N-acetyltransferase
MIHHGLTEPPLSIPLALRLSGRDEGVMTPAPPSITTARLTLRRPTIDDAAALFAFASDAGVTRYVGWSTHREVEQTRGILERTDREWEDNGVGAYLIAVGGTVIGTTGLHRQAAHRAATGYVLNKHAWGQGYATEACTAIVRLGATLGFARVDAICHVDHARSARVLEKSGMAFEGILRCHSMFPNLSERAEHVRSYAWTV